MINNLIIWTSFDYILLFILAFLPMLYKLLFWLYTFQLKEYRWDRLKEYLETKQWKNALFNVFSVVEIILFIYFLAIWYLPLSNNIYSTAFWWLSYKIIFYYLIFLNIFVLWKIFRKRILKPKFTVRLIILLILFIIWWSIDLYFFYKWNLWNFTYLYILGIFLFMPIIIYFYNFISLPLVNYKKNKQINRAINKSKKINNLIKIWITGSYWKSSVKEFLSSILEQDWKLLKTPENQNTEMSVSALVLNKLSNKYKYFVAEMWAYKIWEISLLWKIVNHKYWFLTAIWNQHIWLFGSQENITKGKIEIAESVLKNDWILYVNIDNKEIKKELTNKNSPIIPFYKGDENKKINIVKYWKSKKSDAKYKILEEKNWKIEFSFEYKKINTKFKIDLLWEHNILNLTWVIACCYDLWLKTSEIKKYLKNLKSPDSSKTIIKSGENILIDDTYNLSEAGLKSGIELFKNYKKYNKVLVLDDILELWKDAEKIHFNIAKEIAEKKQVDKILFTWVNYKKSFLEGLIEWWFKKENIILNLNDIKEKSVILFEWRNAKKYLNKLNK